jgi:PAS domain S-box-containing protein
MRIPANYPVNRRILVIDDNPDIHADFRKILAAPSRRDSAMDAAEAQLFGHTEPVRPETAFTLDDASTGQDGLRMAMQARAEAQPYALAFVDMRMPPGWDGLETITRLWTADPELQMVICTAYSDYSWQDIFTRVGASDRLLILKKPFDVIEVMQIAHTMTEKWSLACEVGRQVERLEHAVQERTRSLSETNLRLVESITELQRSGAVLSQSEERFRSVVDTAKSAIAILDGEGGIELWNPGAERLFGWTAAEAGGRPLSLVLPELSGEDLRVRLERFLAVDDATSTTISLLGRDRAGKEFPVEFSLSTWTSQQGDGFSCILQSLDRRRERTAGTV